MEIRIIATFLRVAELQSFSKAAEQLGYSQAAVTVQVKQLEQELGTQLFERIGKHIKLTDHGSQFIPHAMEILNAAQNAKSFIHDRRKPSGTLRIGTAQSLSVSVLPPILLRFNKICPLVETSIHTGLISDLFHMVRQNDIDVLFFLDKRVYFPEWVKIFEHSEPIVFVSSCSHPLAGRHNIPLKRVLTEPFLLTEQGVSYRYDLEQMLAANNLEIHPFLETGDTDIIVKMLLQHAGLSFLPQYVVQDYVDARKLAILNVDIPPIQMWSQLVYHKNKWVTPQMQIFIDLMKQSIVPDSGQTLPGSLKNP